ncbi:unnamed protein product [Spirodela intermedia]|uniref:Uncharacterized protein n=1 Tax=Spirodela intermedia TaxID=51605 RepID=A0A7I8IPU7_SPIIN|nr:unnamed protein product [Spirodela intermedia]CAA6659594.1 unnamed protein product [Spirodela intermedia]
MFFLSVRCRCSGSPRPARAIRNGSGFSRIYAFGDSFTDIGNTDDSLWPFSFGHAHQLPYGSTFGRPTGRYSDGRLVVDFLAVALSLPSPPPYLHPAGAMNSSAGANFAVAGSTAIDHSFFVRNNLSLDIIQQSLGTQLAWFERLMAERGYGERPLLVGEIGVNDNAYIVGSRVSPDQVQELVLDSVTRFLEALLSRGAKYMVVQGHPLSGCLPLTLSLVPAGDHRDDLACSASQNRRSAAFNVLLQSRLDDLRRRHPRAIISYADYAAAHRAPFKTCCGSGGGPFNFDLFATCATPAVTTACPDPRRYINWDGAHLTEAMYKVLADMFIRRGYCRPSFSFLLSSKQRGV